MNILIFWDYNHYNSENVELILSDYNEIYFFNVVREIREMEKITNKQKAFYHLEGLTSSNEKAMIEEIWIKIIKKYSLEIYSVIERDLNLKGLENTSLDVMDIISINAVYNVLNIIKVNKISNLILFDTPHHPATLIAFYVAKELNISTTISKGMPRHHGVTKTRYHFITDNFPFFDSSISSSLRQTESKVEMAKNLNEYLNHYSEPTQSDYNPIHLGYKWSFNYILDYLIKSFITHLKNKSIIKIYRKSIRYIKFFLFEIVSRKVILDYYSKNVSRKIELSNHFIYFPLQFQPEATTTPLGVPFRDQLQLVKLLSKILPEKYKIYVKEHPAFWYRRSSLDKIIRVRSKDYYSNLKNLKNVELISHKANHEDLIKKAKFVVSVTGTVLWEALFYNKKGLMFGNYIYADLPNVVKFKNISTIQKLFDEEEYAFDEKNHIPTCNNTLSLIEKTCYAIDTKRPRSDLFNLQIELNFIFKNIIN